MPSPRKRTKPVACLWLPATPLLRSAPERGVASSSSGAAADEMAAASTIKVHPLALFFPSLPGLSASLCKSPATQSQAVVKTVDMEDSMATFAIETASYALNEYAIEKDMANYIKREFDKAYRCACWLEASHPM